MDRGKDEDKFDKLNLDLCQPGWTDLVPTLSLSLLTALAHPVCGVCGVCVCGAGHDERGRR